MPDASPRYTHYFDLLVANQFSSDIEDFDEAYQAWLDTFSSQDDVARELLKGDFHLINDIKPTSTIDNVADANGEMGCEWFY